MAPAAFTGAPMTMASVLPSFTARSTTLPLPCTTGSAPGAVGEPPASMATPAPPLAERPVISMPPPSVVTMRAPFSSRMPLSPLAAGEVGSLLKL
jgi:hypothetical protein